MSTPQQFISPAGFMAEGRQRVVIENIRPSVDSGRYPVKRVTGEAVHVQADVYADGHDHIRTLVAFRHGKDDAFDERYLEPEGNDLFSGTFDVTKIGTYEFLIYAWIDHFYTWIDGLAKKVDVDSETNVDLLIGSSLLAGCAKRASGEEKKRLAALAAELKAEKSDVRTRASVALDPLNVELAMRYPDRSFQTISAPYRVTVDPPIASFSSWYEFFPRSTGASAKEHGTLKSAIGRIDYVKQLGFDVIYLPPIHPVGTAFRKGPNNALVAQEGDPGSPWAIGAPAGGHTAVHPDLGTVDDLRAFVSEAEAAGIKVALDVAFQCSPDHPWVKEHPEWFVARPDGTIQYAENPPKKYQDIYPINFESDDWENLWTALRDVFLFWVKAGVTIFRVDNPHTKSFLFWEWCIASIKDQHPEALFLAEAFTRPKRMYGLAKKGFSQSYTYFTWRTGSAELREYLEELTHTNVVEFFRPNFWPNTPDILHEYLQVGGRPAFMIRLALAATLTANYGIYGPAFELLERTPRDPGSEEYLNSEKYQVREWNLEDPQSLAPYITKINAIRRENPALHQNRTLRFHATTNANLIAYSKVSADGTNIVLTVVNLSYEHTEEGQVEFSPAAVLLPDSRPFAMRDLLTGEEFEWSEYWNFVSLDPFASPAHIFSLTL
ncbi:MAG: alpha-1,4-glucan--maltose-1-phosphate maltosyltransferase [Spirochaetota bacterium]